MKIINILFIIVTMTFVIYCDKENSDQNLFTGKWKEKDSERYIEFNSDMTGEDYLLDENGQKSGKTEFVYNFINDTLTIKRTAGYDFSTCIRYSDFDKAGMRKLIYGMSRDTTSFFIYYEVNRKKTWFGARTQEEKNRFARKKINEFIHIN